MSFVGRGPRAQTYRGLGDTSWRKRALCKELSPRLALKIFFPKRESIEGAVPTSPELKSLVGGNIHPDAKAAIETCRLCPVMMECRKFALKENYASGIWGGTTTADRRSIRRRRRRGPPQPEQEQYEAEVIQQEVEAHDEDAGAVCGCSG